MANVTVLESSLKLVPECHRGLFFGIILIISVVALIGNALAIWSITMRITFTNTTYFIMVCLILARKQKCLQKVCIITLALADIFSIAMFATNNLDTLSRELKIWKLGEFSCHFIPMGQVLGTTVSSVALLMIAIDRYQNVTVAIVTQKWNPDLWKCIVMAFFCVLACSATSYPMYEYFTYNQIQILHTDGVTVNFEEAYLCAALDKDKLKLYYIIMSVMIFLPLVVVFIWFYYQIAKVVWRHRKPFINKYQCSKRDISDNSIGTPKLETKKTKTVQVQRKIRTFKVIIILMVAFTVCRLPYWLFFVVKMVETMNGNAVWYINLTFTALNMFNCVLNPLLYTFLSQTIYGVKRCHDLVRKVALCCCCFGDKDFDDLRKDNPFVIKFDGKEKEESGLSKCKIKFINIPHVHV